MHRLLTIFLLLLTTSVMAQDMSTLAIPAAAITPHLHLRFSGDLVTYQNATEDWPQSSHLRVQLGLFDYVEVGIHAYNAAITKQGVGYAFSVQPLHEERYFVDWRVGLQQISPVEKYLSPMGIPIAENSDNSFFTSVGKTFRIHTEYPTRLTLGIGTGAFKSSDGSTAEDLSGLFFGLSQNLGVVDILAEFNGQRDFVGVRFLPIPEVALKLGIRNIGKMGEEADRFADVGAFQLGLCYQTPALPRYGLDNERRRSEQLQKQLNSCHRKLEFSDMALNQRLQEITRLQQEAGRNDLYFQKYIEAEAEIYRLKENMDKYRAQAQPPVDYSKINESAILLHNAFLYYYEGFYEKAKEECLKALRLTPNLAFAHTRLGSIYFKLGDKPNALKEWRISLQLEPNNPQLWEMIEQYE